MIGLTHPPTPSDGPDIDQLELVSASNVLNGFRLSARIIPAHRAARGGDWCETFAVCAHVVALSIGDVCGHGREAFAAMLTTRQAVREAALRGLGPARTLAKINRTLCRRHPEVYVSAILGLLDTQRHTLTFANAGHPPPLMAGAFGQQFLEFGIGDLLLGVDAASIPAIHIVKVPAETLLVFYTDGVIERQRDAALGQTLLRNAAAFAHHFSALSAAPVIERQMLLRRSNNDDAAILTARAPSLRMRSAR